MTDESRFSLMLRLRKETRKMKKMRVGMCIRTRSGRGSASRAATYEYNKQRDGSTEVYKQDWFFFKVSENKPGIRHIAERLKLSTPLSTGKLNNFTINDLIRRT